MRHLPLQPVERLNDWLNAADVHLLPKKAEAADLVLPSKLLGILASGRPVVASPQREGTCCLAHQAGACVTPGVPLLSHQLCERINSPCVVTKLAAGHGLWSNAGWTVLGCFEQELKDLSSHPNTCEIHR